MNASLTRSQLRLVVLLVLVAVLGGGYLAVTHKSATQSSTARTTPAVTTPAHTTPAPTKAHTQPATPAKLATHGLPVKVALALRKHSIVVVSLSSPGAGVDQIAAAEAQAGAVATHSGYVNVDVNNQRPGIAIMHTLGIFDTPAVLVVKRPGSVYSDFKGFVDRDVIAQAVADAR